MNQYLLVPQLFQNIQITYLPLYGLTIERMAFVLLLLLSKSSINIILFSSSIYTLVFHFYSLLKVKHKKEKRVENFFTFPAFLSPSSSSCYTSRETRVLIGFNFRPMLSGERSSGEMQDKVKGLLGLTLNFGGR